MKILKTISADSCKIPIVSPGLIFVQKGCFARLNFGGADFWKGFCASKWVGPDNKNSLKQLKKRLSTNSPWADIQEGLLSEGFLHLKFGGAHFHGGGGIIFFWGGGGLLSEFYST